MWLGKMFNFWNVAIVSSHFWRKNVEKESKELFDFYRGSEYDQRRNICTENSNEKKETKDVEKRIYDKGTQLSKGNNMLK